MQLRLSRCLLTGIASCPSRRVSSKSSGQPVCMYVCNKVCMYACMQCFVCMYVCILVLINIIYFIFLDNKTNAKNNTLDNDSDRKNDLKNIAFIIHVSFAFLSMLFNIIIIILFMCFPSCCRSKKPNVMFFIQSVSDLLVAVTMAFDALHINPTYLKLPSHFSTTLHFLYEYSIFPTVTLLLLITIERFLSIKFPLHHRAYITVNKILAAVIFTFILSSIPSIVKYLHILPHHDLLHKKYYITIGSISFGIIITVYVLLVVCYLAIRKSSNTRIKQEEERRSTPDGHNAQIILREKKKNIRIFMIILIMCTIYTVTLLPKIIFNIYYGFRLDGSFIDSILRISFNLLYYLTAFINPLITLFFKDDYKNTLFRCFKRNAPAPAHQNQQPPPQQHAEQEEQHHIEVTAL